jgi:Family of unknown function (DUF6326)
MDANGSAAKLDMTAKLSLLWTFAMFNYLYADVLGLFDPKVLQDVMDGTVSVVRVDLSQGFLLASAVLMETAIAMVLLSRVLPYRANRWANVAVGVLHTLGVLGSMFVGSSPTAYYVFFGTIEIVCTSVIVATAWRWRLPVTAPLDDRHVAEPVHA